MDPINLDLAAHPEFQVGDFWRIFYTAWAGGLFALFLPWGLYRVYKHRDWTMLLIVLGGLLCALGEPMMDQLARVEFASNMPGPAFEGFGREIPYFVPLCYASVIIGSGYWVYRYLQTEVTATRIVQMWAATAVADMVLEMPGTLAGTFRYFGEQPWYVGKFPLHIGVLNATGFFAIGFALFLVVPRLRGWWRLALIAVPAMAFWGFQTAVAWPAWIAVNWEMSSLAQHLVALGVVPLSLLLVKAMAETVMLVKARETPVDPVPAEPRVAVGA